jgi:hypothetical protein
MMPIRKKLTFPAKSRSIQAVNISDTQTNQGKRAAGGIGIRGCAVYGAGWQTRLQTSLPTSATAGAQAAAFAAGSAKAQGSSSSMRAAGWPAAIASRTAFM